MTESGRPSGCIMYIFPFSLYSIMARFTATLGASISKSGQPIAVDYKLVNLHRGENIKEWYLFGLNRKGQARSEPTCLDFSILISSLQVPSMTVEGQSLPITDSLEISYWFCKYYPGLLPDELSQKIRTYLDALHAIEALSLSAPRPAQPQEDHIDPAIDEILERVNISEEYRRALEQKKEL